MKVLCNLTSPHTKLPYLARTSNGALALVGKHSVILIEGSKFGTIDGDGWNGVGNAPHLTRLSRDEPVTLTNE